MARRSRNGPENSDERVARGERLLGESVHDGEKIARSVLQLGDQREVGVLGALALGNVEHHAVKTRHASLLEHGLAARGNPSLRAAVHADDTILDVADTVAGGIHALTQRGLDTFTVVRMNSSDEDAEVHRGVGRQAPHGLEMRVPLDDLRDGILPISPQLEEIDRRPQLAHVVHRRRAKSGVNAQRTVDGFAIRGEDRAEVERGTVDARRARHLPHGRSPPGARRSAETERSAGCR